MPFLIDPAMEMPLPNAKSGPDYINGVPLKISRAHLDEVIYIRYENTNPYRSDIQHGDEWEEEFCGDFSTNPARPRLLIHHQGETQRLREDHGLIIRVWGKPVGVFALTDNGMVSEEEAEPLEEIQQKEFQRFKKWEFRVKYILKTDGPQRRLRLQMANEQRKEEEKAEMFSSIAQAFREAMGGKVAGQGAPATPADLLKGMEIEQIAALLEMKKAEEEDAQIRQSAVPTPSIETPPAEALPEVESVSSIPEPDSLAKSTPLPAQGYQRGVPLTQRRK